MLLAKDLIDLARTPIQSSFASSPVYYRVIIRLRMTEITGIRLLSTGLRHPEHALCALEHRAISEGSH